MAGPLGFALASAAVFASLAFGGAPEGALPKAREPERSPVPVGAPRQVPSLPETRCAQPIGEPIPAERVLKDLADGKSVDLSGRIIEGNFDAEAAWKPAGERKASLRVVTGRLRLDSCRVSGGIKLPHCVFAQDVILSCSQILGDLDLSESDVRGAVHVDRAHITGDARFTSATIEGDIHLKKTVLDGSLEISSVRAHDLNLQQAELGRSLELIDSVVGVADLAVARIGGSVKIQNVLVLGQLMARDATLGSGFSLNSVKVVGSTDLSGGSVAGDLALVDVSSGKDVRLPHVSYGSMELTDVSVGHDLALTGGSFQDVRVHALKVMGSSDLQSSRFGGSVEISDSDFGSAFSARRALFAGACEFRKVRFPGEDPMAGAQFSRAPTLVETILPHVPAGANPAGYDAGSEQSEDDRP